MFELEKLMGLAGKDWNAITSEQLDRAEGIMRSANKHVADHPSRADQLRDLAVAAIRSDSPATDAELSMLRACRASAPLPLGSSNGSASAPALLEAGLLLSMGMRDRTVAGFYGDAATDQASGAGYRGMGIQGIMRQVLRSHGQHAPEGTLRDSHIRQVFELSASTGVSNISLSGILSNVANKMLLASFQGTGTTWQTWCRASSTNDLKERSSYRMTAGGRLEQVAPNGHIQHADLSEATHTNQARTYGRMLGLTRTDLINDDLGALQSAPGMLGRMAAVSLERAVYTAFLDSAAFFAAGNNNLLTGAGSALALAGLDDAVESFQEQLDTNGDPTMLMPAVLLVPPAIHGTARSLMNSQAVIDSTAGETEANRWQGLAEVVSSPYLGVTVGLTGGSDTAWYLLTAPGDFSVIDVAFLNGVMNPTIEQGELDFSMLGIQMRCYFDFGIAFLETAGGVKSAGA